MTKTMTTQEAGNQLNVSHVTIKKYLEMFFPGEPMRDTKGRRCLTEDQLKILQTVCALKAEDKSLQSIVRIVGPVRFNENEPAEQLQSSRTEDELQSSAIDLELLTQTITAQVTSSVVSSIQANTEMAERYARAAHQIGSLEQQVSHLTQQLHQAQDRIKLLEQPKDMKPWWRIW